MRESETEREKGESERERKTTFAMGPWLRAMRLKVMSAVAIAPGSPHMSALSFYPGRVPVRVRVLSTTLRHRLPQRPTDYPYPNKYPAIPRERVRARGLVDAAPRDRVPCG